MTEKNTHISTDKGKIKIRCKECRRISVTKYDRKIGKIERGSIKSPVQEEISKAFWKFVRKTESCWEWLGSKSGSGYGDFRFSGIRIKAHIFSYALIYGDQPKNLDHHHICENKACVNPKHIKVLTRSQHLKEHYKANQ